MKIDYFALKIIQNGEFHDQNKKLSIKIDNGQVCSHAAKLCKVGHEMVSVALLVETKRPWY